MVWGESPVVKKIIMLIVVFLILCTASDIYGSEETSDERIHPWPRALGDQRNTGLSTYDTSNVDGTVKWAHNISEIVVDDIQASTSIVIGKDDVVYLSTVSGHLIAISQSGDFLWKYHIDSSPLMGDNIMLKEDLIYVSSIEGLHLISSSGKLEWSLAFPRSPITGPIVDDDGKVYVGCYGGDIFCVDNGEILWNYSTDYVLSSSLALHNDTLYVGGDWSITALNTDGTKKWFKQLSYSVMSPPTISTDGTVYFMDHRGELYALFPSGSTKWSYDLSTSVFYESPSIGPDGTLYVPAGSGMYAFTPNGDLKWDFQTVSNINPFPAIGADGTIYFGNDRPWVDLSPNESSDKHVYALNTDGSLKWSYEFDGDVFMTSPPAIGSDGTVYVATSDGTIYAFGGSVEEKDGIPSIGSFTTLSMIVSTAVIFSWRRRKLKPRGDRRIAKRT